MNTFFELGKGRYILVALMLMAASLSVTAEAGALKMGDVAKELICQCGCNNVLGVCEMTGWAVPAKELIQEKIDQGLNKEQVLAYFVEEYGTKILAAPPKKGFNLIAWIMPFAVIGAGAILILLLLRVWTGANGTGREDEPGPLEGMTEEEVTKYKKAMRDEIKSWKY